MLERKRGISVAARGRVRAITSGQRALTSAHSSGLSSTSTKVSTPTLSSRASERRFWDLASQLIRQAAKCSRRNSMSGCRSSTASTSSSAFLLHRHSSIPSRRWASANSCRATRGGSMTTPSGPSSPTTPLHSVWSQSRTRTFGGGTSAARSVRTISVPRDAKRAGVYGMWPWTSVPGSSYASIW